jgi:hypothetical protein
VREEEIEIEEVEEEIEIELRRRMFKIVEFCLKWIKVVSLIN